ncbi:MAG TPA: 16S rRNA (guanine(527)-N(7))-methyltransferase RsmG [Actinobacteria bacterium]|nr:16S rRNA (guanine(527)-N(7))-methyltransferase RsmG [Actinomycetota bacterium]
MAGREAPSSGPDSAGEPTGSVGSSGSQCPSGSGGAGRSGRSSGDGPARSGTAGRAGVSRRAASSGRANGSDGSSVPDEPAGPGGVAETGEPAGQITDRVDEVPPTPAQARAIFGSATAGAEHYARLLAGPGVVRGLIGPREVPRLWERHLLNSAAIAELIPRPCSLIDLGSGAGLPGIVLALLLPDVQVTLLEPMQRRVTFLAECVHALGLENVEIVRGRAEELAGRISADVVTARAVAPLDRLAVLASGLVRPGGVVLAIKGGSAWQEVAAASPALQRLGMRDVTVVRAGSGKVDPAATVVRLIAGRQDNWGARARQGKERGGGFSRRRGMA